MLKLYVGLDVSLEMTSVCAVDEDGVIRLETKAISDPAAIAAVLGKLDGAFERAGLEAGPLSQWLFFGLKDAGLPAVCIETRHAKAAIGAMSANKTASVLSASTRTSKKSSVKCAGAMMYFLCSVISKMKKNSSVHR